MANLLDYLDWRGDLTFEQAPFNGIDSLIFSRLAYFQFEQIVAENFTQKISLSEALRKLQEQMKTRQHSFSLESDQILLSKLLTCPRFKNLSLSGYHSQSDEKTEEQFSSLLFELPDQTLFIAFRGTDDSLVGLKEDLNMSFMEFIPSQKKALAYLEKVTQEYTIPIRLGGHSKGGNLAVFAGSFASETIQEQIISIYNHDGPGFHQPVLKKSGYQRIQTKIHTFAPESSIVGMLLEHEEKYTLVQSTRAMLFQHDVYTWQLMGNQFLTVPVLSDNSLALAQTVKDWLQHVRPKQRKIFIDTLFSIIQATDAKTVSDLNIKWYANALIILRSYHHLDSDIKKMLGQTLGIFLKSAMNTFQTDHPDLPKLEFFD